jgi:hypothetical protein
MAPSTTSTGPNDPQSARSNISMTFPTPCAEPKLHNSRRRKRAGFTGYVSSASSPEFRQPPKLYTGGKHPGAPPISTRAGELTRTTQIPPTPTRTESSKTGRGRDTKPKPYVLEPPPQAQMFPENRKSLPGSLVYGRMLTELCATLRLLGFLPLERQPCGGHGY